MYVGCDELGSIPKEITVTIGSSCYSINIKIEAQIKEPVEVRVSQDDMEQGERLLEGSPGAYRKLEGSEEPKPDRKEKSKEESRSPQLQAPTTSAQVTSDMSEGRAHLIGKARPRSTVSQIEAKQRFTWIRDRMIQPSAGDQRSWEAD